MVLKEQSTSFGQTSSQMLFPTHNLDFIDLVSGIEFCTQFMAKQNLVYHHFSNQNLKTLVCDRICLYAYFLHHRWELHTSIKTGEVLLTGLRKSYALPSSFEVSNLSQMHKRCKTGTQTFFKYHGKKSPSKTLVWPFFFLSPLAVIN